ncbi:MAG: flavodoxin family protein [Deltaproteobacteria bacterium]|nr:flavodoxin family protein [Deltaproteobacteria bacterium]
MEVQKIRVLGIHSSPFRGGNTAYLLEHALQEAAKGRDVETEAVALTGLAFSDCTQCNWCMRKQTPAQLCKIDDDISPILMKIRDCDVLVLASPVYFARLSGLMACLIDRTRCFIFGKEKHLALKGKVGIALSVAWTRNGGIETTLESIHSAFLLHEMWTPSVHPAGAIFGVGAVSGQMNEDLSYKTDKLGVREDKQALQAAGMMMKKAVRTAGMLKSLKQ